MKKSIISILAGAAIVIWTTTIIIYVTTGNEISKSSNLSEAYTPSFIDRRDLNVHRVALLEEDKFKEDKEVKTIIGQHMLTEDWVTDMRMDGKVSIDTILNALEIDRSSLVKE
ncbi:hypothetical protein [Halobacillus andaensis]|nr:hypothetical protein [Halobacillus andaensis]MBP2002833.1 hypothetical protein [Halobacillus andaensis]